CSFPPSPPASSPSASPARSYRPCCSSAPPLARCRSL
ncbi:MAG: hypothetical protein AVDCRST_MAG09-768, partial [uncultured Sphingomonas sp.]